ncbi:MAG: exosortase A [Gammaproteobacteria bacterium]|nr:exosortase A [Gammaproteobacteria bacterium]
MEADATLPLSRVASADPAGMRLRLLILALLGAALLLLYRDSWLAMAHIWWVSDTFAHGMFILPLSGWLVYRLRQELQQTPVTTGWLALPLLVLLGFGWALARFADVLVIQQFAVIAMIPLLVLLVYGQRLTAAIAFPLGFLLMAVPVGEGLIPYLIDWTADFVVFALRLTGLPVFREGNDFTIPSGKWSVVTGCSGLRYLMATLTIALLYAYLSYRATWRRVVFVLAGIAVAIVGNWLRAYGIVMIAHLSGMKLALGVDHFIYGWVFFGILIFAVMWLGAAWREPEPEPAVTPLLPPLPPRQQRPTGTWAMSALGAGLVVLILAPMLVGVAEQRAAAFAAHRLRSDAPAGWTLTEDWNVRWRPEHFGAAQVLDEWFSDGAQRVGVFLAWYPAQRQGAELINARNRLLYEKDRDWRELRGRGGVVPWGAMAFPYRESHIEARADDVGLLVWHGWWVSGRFTTNPYLAKLYEALGALLGQGRRGAWVVLYTPDDEAARTRLTAFANAYAATFERMIRDTAPAVP